MNWQFEICQITDRHWCWKLRRPNGNMLCLSDEVYTSVEKTEKAIKELQTVVAKKIKVVDMDSPKEVKKRGGGRPSRKETPAIDKPTQREIDEKK